MLREWLQKMQKDQKKKKKVKKKNTRGAKRVEPGATPSDIAPAMLSAAPRVGGEPQTLASVLITPVAEKRVPSNRLCRELAPQRVGPRLGF